MTNTLFIGKVYHRFDQLPSTNDWAAELLAKSKPPEGTVVRADSQSAGRGQFGSRWESAAGKNLTISIILYPRWLEVSAQFYLSMAVALGVRDAVNPTPGPSPEGRGAVERSVEDTAPSPTPVLELSTDHSTAPLPSGEGPGVGLKWPNDLYLGDHKAAGILIQCTLSGQFLQSAVVGIGLNVNQLEFDPGLPNPTSLALHFDRSFDLDTVAQRLFECLERRYLQLKSGQREVIKSEYEKNLYRLDKPSKFIRINDGLEFTGTIRGVTKIGQLLVETEKIVEEYNLKEIKFL